MKKIIFSLLLACAASSFAFGQISSTPFKTLDRDGYPEQRVFDYNDGHQAIIICWMD